MKQMVLNTHANTNKKENKAMLSGAEQFSFIRL